MKRLLSYFSLIALAGCSYGGAPLQVAPGSQVGGVGNMQFDHKPLSGNMHMITLHVAPGIMETEGSMARRQVEFANEFAAKTCKSGYTFIADPNAEVRLSDLTQRTKVYTFRCA